MKIPINFSIGLFFRLILPGFLLSVGILPLLQTLLDNLDLSQQIEAVFAVATVGLGWLMIASDMPVYMLLEGRRYWPDWLWSLLHGAEKRRLGRINQRIDDFYATDSPSDTVERKYREAGVELRSFPIGPNGEHAPLYPTRLGNTITAYETYSKSRYGLEAIFYWPRIWINLSKELRQDIDDQQALADSAVYATVALLISGMLWLALGLTALLGIQVLFPLWLLFVGGGALFLMSYPAYRVAVVLNQQFGVIFMSVIDANVLKVHSDFLPIKEIVSEVKRSFGPQLDTSQGDFDIVRRYLQYYNVKLVGQRRAVSAARDG